MSQNLAPAQRVLELSSADLVLCPHHTPITVLDLTVCAQHPEAEVPDVVGHDKSANPWRLRVIGRTAGKLPIGAEISLDAILPPAEDGGPLVRSVFVDKTWPQSSTAMPFLGFEASCNWS